MSDKTDKKVIKGLIKQAKEIDQQLSSALNAEKSEIANLRRAADTFLNEKMQDTLQSMDVDMLSQGKQKIRVSYLHSAGINTIGQLTNIRKLNNKKRPTVTSKSPWRAEEDSRRRCRASQAPVG